MATTKKTTVKKNASKKQVTNNQSNETRVLCPVCGTEFAIGEHEHEVKNGIAIGKDSGLGVMFMPVSKRGEALQAAGIDTNKYFSMKMQNGDDCLMTYDENGRPVPVDDSDPILQAIINGGTVPNRKLFRRWIMSQVFHALTQKDYRDRTPIGFGKWLTRHGYEYQWKMIIKELEDQAKLYGKDMENYAARNRWFNKNLVLAMANNYIKQLRNDLNNRKPRTCKGVPYICVKGFPLGVFVNDIEKKIINPLECLKSVIYFAKTPKELADAVRKFWGQHIVTSLEYKQCSAWKDSYRGMGAYATMQNLLRFHGCTFPKHNEFFKRGQSGLQMLEDAARTYETGEGWKLFGLMKQMIEENHIDIEGKMREWSNAKSARINHNR